jgi:hypothetical protein
VVSTSSIPKFLYWQCVGSVSEDTRLVDRAGSLPPEFQRRLSESSRQSKPTAHRPHYGMATR